MPNVLAFDVGGTKTAWAVITEEGTITKKGVYPTPLQRQEFLKEMSIIIEKNKTDSIGIGIAGTVSTDHDDVIVCTNLPSLSHFELRTHIEKTFGIPVAMDNDARCALIGEVWKGAAQNTSSAVLVTIGTGIGGAIMQREHILPHPEDVSKELGRIIADATDLFPAPTGHGTVEALIGGKSLEARFDISLKELSAAARKGDEEALETWKVISYYFIESIRAIYQTYQCKMILVGGKGAQDLDLYLQDKAPCPVTKADLGEDAGLLGAARIGLDAKDDLDTEAERGWDE